jgi:hypothetical protein
MLIKVQNTLADIAPFSYLTNATVTGAGTIPVKNINQFTANWAIQVGATGGEQSEILVLNSSAPSGTSLIATGTARFDHPADTQVFAIKFDQAIFKRSTSGTAGTASAITDGTVNLTPDSTYTAFDDTTGAATYAYKVAFYNSVTTETSVDSDWLTPTGYSFFALAKIRERIKSKLFNPDFIRNDGMIDDWINEWKERMDNAAVDVNKDYSLGTVDVSFGTAELGTISADGFKDVRRVWFTTDGNTYFQATKMAINSYDPNQTFSSTHPYFYMLGDDVIGRKPVEGNGTARIVYYKYNSPLVNDTDTLPTVMKNYTKSFVDYGLSQALYMDNQLTQAARKEKAALDELDRYKNEIASRLKTGANSVQVVEEISGDDLNWW